MAELSKWAASPGIFYLKNAIHKKCQAEYPADTKKIGGDFRRQPATFDNPDKGSKAKQEPALGVQFRV